jgi:hypothetical protein
LTETTRPVGRGSPPTAFPKLRDDPFSGYTDRPTNAGAPPPYGGTAGPSRRRGSSLRERYPGDDSHKPLDIIRKDSRKANRSPHLKKHSLQGADIIDRLDPALGGRPYHHEGPYDAASFARNRDPSTAPVAALKSTNEEALKATPRENVRDALERHKPLDGVAIVPPGQPDQLGRTYNYEEGTDMMREGLNTEPGYKRWPGKVCNPLASSVMQYANSNQDYDPEDLQGQAEPSFSLDRALKAHKIDDDGIEMEDHAHINRDYHHAERDGTLDKRDPVAIAGGDRKYHELARTNDTDLQYDNGRHDIKKGFGSIKKRIGSLRHRKDDN